jgi:hypothetical protein
MKYLKYFESKGMDDIVDDIKGLLVELGDINIIYFVEYSNIGISIRLERESPKFKISEVRDFLITISDYLKEYYKDGNIRCGYTTHFVDRYGRKDRELFDIYKDEATIDNLTMFCTYIKPEAMNKASEIWNSLK